MQINNLKDAVAAVLGASPRMRLDNRGAECRYGTWD